jgi:hypothetical protein
VTPEWPALERGVEIGPPGLAGEGTGVEDLEAGAFGAGAVAGEAGEELEEGLQAHG